MQKILCLLLTMILAFLCCACQAGGNLSADSERLTYYYTPEYQDDLVEIMQRYNRWCTSHSTEDMKINLIEFESFDTMSQRLNIEVMSGGGPDLFSNDMDLPFEKLLENGAFYDLNTLIESDTAADRLDLDDYNRTIMDAGVYDGKRYYMPAFYYVPTLIGEKDVFEQFGMPTQQGYHLTYDNMDAVFEGYLENPGEYIFMGGGTNADTVMLRLVDSQVDFENKSITFDEDFKNKLELLTKLRSRFNTSSLTTEDDAYDSRPHLFSSSHTYSNPIWMEFMMNPPAEFADFGFSSEFDDPVLYSCFEDDKDTYSACIAHAVFVNARTKHSDKVLAFLKYLLGEHIQNLYAGTDEEYWSGGGYDFLPVLNSAYESCVRTAHNVMDIYGSTVEVKEKLHPTTQALIEHIEHINTVYLYADLYASNYNRNVALPILQDYWNGKADVNKCVDNLSSATKIYILE